MLAYACNRFGLDPATSVVGHFFLDPTRRTDPVTGLARSRRTYEQLLRDVVAENQACTGAGLVAAPGAWVPGAGNVVAAVKLNVRKGQPSMRADVVQVVSRGTALAYDGWVENGEALNGNSRWYRDPDGNFFWSGGVA